MIDSGASSSVMPNGILVHLGIKYEPITRGVVQLDGTSSQTMGVIKDLNITLHDCSSCSVLQDISVIDLPTYFAICLSREFTAKIGGCLSFDYSHMLFRTRYGTKVTIRVELAATDHIEPYTPSPINMNCTLNEEKEEILVREPTTVG